MKFIKKYFPLLIAVLLLTISSVIYNSNLFSFFTALFGITYIYLIGKKEWTGYIFGITNNIMYAYTVFSSGMKLSALYYIGYAVPVMVIGLIYWKRNNVESKTEAKLSKFLKLLLFILIAFALIGIIIFGEEKLYYDLVITLFSSIALLLMAKNYKEQWLIWVFANIIGSLLWTGIFINTLQDMSLFIMWFIYLINSVYFLFEQKKQTK